MPGRRTISGLAVVLLVGALPLSAQLPRPLIPLPETGLRVVPFFDGWYDNPDGTISFSFGYSNLNKDVQVEIPYGPDNFIVPKEYDGRQPTYFPVVGPDAQDGGGGRPDRGASTAPVGATVRSGTTTDGNSGRDRDRDRGVFTVTVPASFKGDVVWTLRYAGQTFSVPGRSKATQYQLSWPAAMGTVPPLVRFQPNGEAGRGPVGIQAATPLQAKVGVPLPLTIWVTDDAVHDKEPIKFGRERAGMNVTWFKHSGPTGPVVFDPAKMPFPELTGQSATNATFREPGEYVIRVKADAFGYSDSSSGNQCCWTNGYQKVTVTR